MSGVIVRSSDLRFGKICSTGTRMFFKAYGLDYSDFLKNGITEEKLMSLNNGKGDANAIRAINIVKEREASK